MRIHELLVVLASLTPAVSLAAAPPTVLELAGGYGGPMDDEGGAGNEQATVATVVREGKTYLVTVYMSSDVSSGDRPWQCKCSSVELDPIAGPKVVASKVKLTALDGNRPCNHPKITSDGETILWTYGSNHSNQATVRTWVSALDESCNEIGNRLRISTDANNNEGAPDITFAGGKKFTAGYLSTGTNDRSVAVGLEATRTGDSVTITKTWQTTVVAPSNIGRPSILPLSETRSLFCAAKGDQRPPEDGVECGLLDSSTGEVLWRELIAASDPSAEPRIYMNQPQLASLGEGRVAMLAIQSTGEGRRSGEKGASLTHVYTLAPDDLGAHVESKTSGLGYHQAHATICTGAFGLEGGTHIGVFDASITGGGLAKFEVASWDPTAMSLLVRADSIAGGERGDSGYIANLYGQNPGMQGREFMRCIGDVPNPGFAVAGGFRPEVKTFFALPYTGRKEGEPKNALFLSLLPGAVAASTPPPPPPDDGGGSGGGGNPPPGGNGGVSTSSRGSCSIGDHELRGGVASGLLALAYLSAFTAAWRRRKGGVS